MMFGKVITFFALLALLMSQNFFRILRTERNAKTFYFDFQ